MGERAPASWEQLSHTAEVKIRVRAASFGELAAEAGRALSTLEVGALPPGPYGPWRTFEVRARDRASLLVDWLNELIYQAETACWVGVIFAPLSATDTHLAMRAQGVVLDETPAHVKAATFHGLDVETTPDDGWVAEVIFDV